MKNGFTLAEVLITLGVIGVIAAITIPGLITNDKKQATITQLKKTYSILNQAAFFSNSEANEYTTIDFNDGDLSEMINWFNAYIKSYLQVTKECHDTSGCWHTNGKTKTLNGGTPPYDRGNIGIGINIITFIGSDGAMYCLDVYGKNDAQNLLGINTEKKFALVIFVDINGDKFPNIIGKDVFVLILTEKGFIPAGHDKTDEQIKADCSLSGSGYFCLEKLIRNNWQTSKTDFI